MIRDARRRKNRPRSGQFTRHPSAQADGRMHCLMEALEQRLLLSNADLLSEVRSAMIDYANGAGPQQIDLPKADLGSFLTLDGISIAVDNVMLDSQGHLLSGSATLSVGNGELFPGWDAFGASITDSADDANDWALRGTYDVVNGFSLSVDKFSLSLDQVFTAEAEGISIGYNPTITGAQTLVTVASGTITFPLLKPPGSPDGGVQGSLSDLEIRTDGFKIGALSVAYLGEVSFGDSGGESLLSLTGVGVGITNFDVTFSPDLSISGGIEVFATSASLFPDMADAPFKITISDGDDADTRGISTGLEFTNTGQLKSVQFSLDTLEVQLTEYFTFSASGINLNTGAGADEMLLEVGELSGTLKVENLLSVTVGGGHFGITGGGDLKMLPGFGVWVKDADFNKAMQELGWPEWISVTVDELGAYWPDFNADPLDFQVVLSGSIGAMFEDLGLPLTIEGSVTNARFDVGELLAARNPLVGLDAASFSISGDLFGATIGAEGTLGIIRYDANYQEVEDPFDPYVGSLLYAGFGGKLGVPGFEFQMRLGFSELGPLAFYGYADVPIPVGGPTGLTIGGFRAGVSFYSSLPDPVDQYGELDPALLRGDAFAIPGEMSWTEWSNNLRKQALSQLQSGGSLLGLFTAPMIFTGGGKLYDAYATQAAFAADATVMLDTSGKILIQADVEFGGGMIEGVKMYFFGSLANIQAGNAKFAFLVDLPAEPRIASVYGYLELLFLDANGDRITSILQPASTMQMKIGGGAEITALGLAGATLDGDIVLSLSGLDTLFTSNPDLLFTMEVSARLSVTYLGDIGAAAGTLVIDTFDYTDGNGVTWKLPELHGALYVQTNLSALEAVGIYAFTADPYDPNDTGASGLLRLNTSPEVETVSVTMPAEDPNAGTVYTWDLDPLSLSLLAMGGFQFRLADIEWFTLFGSAYMELSPNGVKAQIEGEVYLLDDPADPDQPLLSVDVLGYLSLSPAGFVAVFDATLDSNFPAALDLVLEGEVDMALNTTGQDFTLVIPDALPAVDGQRTFTLSGAPYAGDPYGPYLRLDIDGTLDVAGLAVLDGMFHMLVTPQAMEVETHALASLGTIVWTLDGGMRIDGSGLVAALDANLDTGLPPDYGITLAATCSAEINTTGKDATVGGILVEKDHFFTFHADGTMKVLWVSMYGSFDMAVRPDHLAVDVDARINFFNTTVFVSGLGRLYFGSYPGMVLDVGLGIDPAHPLGIPGILSMSAALDLEVNSRAVWSDGLSANYAKVGFTNANMTLLGILNFSGSGSASYNQGMFRLALDNFYCNLFGLATIRANGWIQSDGQYNLSFYGYLSLGDHALGIDGSASLYISQIGQVFSLSGSIQASAWVLWINVWSGSAAVSYNSASGLINVTVTYPVLWWTETITVTIGALHPSGPIPQPEVRLGEVQPDGTLRLYVGSDADKRGSDTTTIDETFIVSAVGAGTSRGQKISVSSFGTSTTFDNVLRIQADAGSGNDYIALADNVSVPATLYGGTGIDRLKGGSGNDTLYGQDGRDRLQGGAGSDWLYPGDGDDVLEGGTGNDRYIFAAGFDNVEIVEETGEGNDVVDLSALSSALSVTVGSLAVSNTTGGSIQHNQSNIEQMLLGSGNDTIRVTSASPGITIDAGGGNDTLIGPNAGATFTITGLNAGNVAGVTFESIENLTGGTGADTFAFLPAGSLSGDVDGGAGSDTLDCGSFAHVVQVNLETKKATGIGGTFGGIEDLVGSGESDELIGPNAGATFTVSGANAGNAAGVTFTSIENLTGGTGADIFVFQPGGSLSGDVDGGAGSDTLDYTQYGKPVTVNLETKKATAIGGTFGGIEDLIGGGGSDRLIGPDAGATFTVDGADAGNVAGVTFTSMENLTGGTGADRFAFLPAGSLSGDVEGGAGSDTLDYSLYAQSVTVNLETMTSTGIGGTFGGIEHLVGSSESDELIGPDAGATFTVDGADAGNAAGVTFTSIENLTGGTGADTFAFLPAGSLSGDMEGGAGSDTLDYSGYGESIVVNLETKKATGIGGTFGGIEHLVGSGVNDTLIGPNAGATFTVDGANAGNAAGVTFESIENLTGGTGADTFAFLPAGSLSGDVDGGDGSDKLDYSQYDHPVTVNLETMTSTGIGGTFGGIEHLVGSDESDELIGPDAGATFTVDGANAGSAAGVTFTSIENLTGGTGADTFVFLPAGSLSGDVDGGDGTDTLDYRALDTAVTVDLAAGIASAVASVTNVEDVYGGSGDDFIAGDDGANVLDGGPGEDVILGRKGDDRLFGGTGDDVMYGQGGDDYMEGNVGNDTMLGGDGNDRMIGGSSVLTGTDGSDWMFGQAADDVMAGDDAIIDVLSNVTPLGSAGNDNMIGGQGNDKMYGQDGADVMLGDDGTIAAVSGKLQPETTAPLRMVTPASTASDGNDTMFGNGGDDTMYGQGGKDTMYGGDGMDRMEGNSGDDTMSGGSGDDDMIGGSSIAGTPDGNDTMNGDGGNDVMLGDNGIITRMVDTATNTYKRYTPGNRPGTGIGPENNAVIRNVVLLDEDTIGGRDTMHGGAGDDIMHGGLGNDTMFGDDGNDDMYGELGDDYMDGGAGNDGMVGDKGIIVDDILDGSTAMAISTQGHKISADINPAGVLQHFVTLFDQTNGGNDTMLGGTGNDQMHGGAGMDLMRGGDGNDALFGDLGDDTILGESGDDHLYGGAGDDFLDGGLGADIAFGGDGQDTLVADQTGDRLVDWFGNFNTFIVPFKSFGAPVIIRSPAPQMQQFFLDLAAGDGATDPFGEILLVIPPSFANSGHGGRP